MDGILPPVVGHRVATSVPPFQILGPIARAHSNEHRPTESSLENDCRHCRRRDHSDRPFCYFLSVARSTFRDDSPSWRHCIRGMASNVRTNRKLAKPTVPFTSTPHLHCGADRPLWCNPAGVVSVTHPRELAGDGSPRRSRTRDREREYCIGTEASRRGAQNLQCARLKDERRRENAVSGNTRSRSNH